MEKMISIASLIAGVHFLRIIIIITNNHHVDGIKRLDTSADLNGKLNLNWKF